MPKGRRINLIGHSYGGDTAADIVEILPNRIHTLITIDPVSRINFPDYTLIRRNSSLRINVNAVSPVLSNGDIAAFFGGSWNDSSKDYSNIHIRAPFTHKQFEEMMHYKPSQTHQSPQELLNKYSKSVLTPHKKYHL
jgi:pimeloyl-ACP methyl ester carboxylesterase